LKPKILVVDDIPSNIQILIDVLKDQDYEILAATSGITALNIATDEIPDLILLDITMPNMDGYEVCVRLKANVLTHHIPVIFITARDEEEEETRGFELGAVDYINKPIKPAITRARVKTHLELKKQRDILENLSNLDGLTGIPNRRRFDEMLEQEWQHAMRSHLPLSLIMIDIDYFKRFNDHYGHNTGDVCLKQVAQTLATAIERKTDFIARYGGEEFVCILPMTDAKGAIVIAKKLQCSVFSLHIPHVDSLIADRVTISQGVTTIFPTLIINHKALIEVVDKALYQAKTAGRNQIKTVEIPTSGKLINH
jgi:diguanylate cyclase (GGDEF)-like protein